MLLRLAGRYAAGRALHLPALVNGHASPSSARPGLLVRPLVLLAVAGGRKLKLTPLRSVRFAKVVTLAQKFALAPSPAWLLVCWLFPICANYRSLRSLSLKPALTNSLLPGALVGCPLLPSCPPSPALPQPNKSHPRLYLMQPPSPARLRGGRLTWVSRPPRAMLRCARSGAAAPVPAFRRAGKTASRCP